MNYGFNSIMDVRLHSFLFSALFFFFFLHRLFVNLTISFFLQSAMYFKFLNEHLTWFFENKKFLKERLKAEKEAKKAIEEAKKAAEKKAAKKAK